MNHSYHTTTPLTHDQLIGAQWMARVQEERVLSIFRANPDSLFSPRQIWKLMIDLHKKNIGPEPMELGSIRRSMSNLTRDGFLIHYEQLHIPGAYKNHPETLWGLNNSPDQGEKLADKRFSETSEQ